MPNPAKPLEMKRKLGDPGKRGLPDINETIAVQGGYVEPHQELGEAGQQLWDRAFSHAKNWISHTDVEALMVVCKQLDRQLVIQSVFEADPSDFHMARQLLELEKAIMSGLGLLGFTVDARSRLGLAEIKAESMFQKLMSERN